MRAFLEKQFKIAEKEYNNLQKTKTSLEKLEKQILLLAIMTDCTKRLSMGLYMGK